MGRYWPWIKEAQAAAEEVAAKSVAAKLQAMADEAERAAEIAQQEAEAAVNAHITEVEWVNQFRGLADGQVLDKLQIAYRSQVQMFAHRLNSVLDAIWSQAEEVVALRRGMELAEDVGDPAPLKLMPLQRKGDSFSDIHWETVLPPGSPRVVWFDLNFQGTWSATQMQTALNMTGDKGMVLLSSADNVADSLSMNACEQSMLKSIDCEHASVARLYLSWEAGQTGWLTIVLNHTDLDRLQQEGSPLLKRLISSLKCHKSVAITCLQPASAEEIVRDSSDKGRAMFPAQRGHALYKRLFERLGITQPGMSQAWDFTMVEADAGVGELMPMAAAALDETTPYGRRGCGCSAGRDDPHGRRGCGAGLSPNPMGRVHLHKDRVPFPGLPCQALATTLRHRPAGRTGGPAAAQPETAGTKH